MVASLSVPYRSAFLWRGTRFRNSVSMRFRDVHAWLRRPRQTKDSSSYFDAASILLNHQLDAAASAAIFANFDSLSPVRSSRVQAVFAGRYAEFSQAAQDHENPIRLKLMHDASYFDAQKSMQPADPSHLASSIRKVLRRPRAAIVRGPKGQCRASPALSSKHAPPATPSSFSAQSRCASSALQMKPREIAGDWKTRNERPERSSIFAVLPCFPVCHRVARNLTGAVT